MMCYKANGDKMDSTHHQSFATSLLNVTKATPLPGGKSYLLSGTGSFEVIYFPSGTSSSADVHHFQLLSIIYRPSISGDQP